MIAARRQKQRPEIFSRGVQKGGLKSQHVLIEAPSRVEISDMQMHVSDPGVGVGPRPRRRVALEFAEELLRIERSVPEAQQLPRFRPLLAWKVPGQLDAVAFRIGDEDSEVRVEIYHDLD